MTVIDDSVTRLLRSSARRSYDPEVDLDWDGAGGRGLWWMQPERISLYGTDLWETLTPSSSSSCQATRSASIVHMGWWFEVILMHGLLREVYTGDPRSPRTQYLLTEVGDECRHSTMFGRAMTTAGVPSYGPPPACSASPTAQRRAQRPEPVCRRAARRGDARPLAARLDERRARAAADPDGQPDPRHGGGPPRHLRPRRARPDVAGLSRLGLAPTSC